MVTTEQDEKITYTTMGVEQAQAFNQKFEQAMAGVRNSFGQEYPIQINGIAKVIGKTFEDRSPDDTRQLLGTFQDAGQAEADAAIRAAQGAFTSWSRRDWRERL
ncbi:MAG TPA: aldehyde dehydrogenase family protein, partial [Chloroflexota bacterium]|nr:aldehyde dehydrogenase family protein [Chloroflexota bacterium]